LTYLARKKCYGPDKKILSKKQLFDLEVKGHYGMRHTTLWSCTHIPNIIDLSRKKQLFDLEVKGQGSTKVITVCDTPPYGHAPTYQISLTYLQRQKNYGLDKKILFKKQLFDLEVKGQGQRMSIQYVKPPYGHAPTYQLEKVDLVITETPAFQIFFQKPLKSLLREKGP
jgi:hypothetical protein